jgi:hypothetical protein
MKIFELDADARLTREMIKEFGEEYSVVERISLNAYGIGNLRLVSAHPSLLKFYDSRDHTIKTHFDWTKKGAVIRIRTMDNIYAVGLTDSEIASIEMTKEADQLLLLPFSPGRILLKLGLSHRILKWIPFMLTSSRYRYGAAIVKINLKKTESLVFELKGDLWKASLSTFMNTRTEAAATIVDKGYILL